uniref:Myostatin b n=1 Tax=Eptatretus burgeri TaxID=7764 RepID=A0A8C4NKP9_EPTBU
MNPWCDGRCSLIMVAHAFPSSTADHDQLMSLKIKPKCCFFKINQDILSRFIVKADLWICLKPLRHDTDVTVGLTRLQHMEDGDLGRVHLRSINMHVTASDVTQWHSIDAKKLLQEELEHLQPKWGLEIHALDPEGQDVVITDQTQAGDERLKPFLDLEFAELKKQVKRSLSLDCTEASGEMQCCRYMLVVDLNAIGFDWVIAPKTYQAYYCTGLCNQMSLQRYPHTQLVSRVNANGWGPCCSPTKMSAISMIYFTNSQNIMSRKISDMVVDRCGCS